MMHSSERGVGAWAEMGDGKVGRSVGRSRGRINRGIERSVERGEEIGLFFSGKKKASQVSSSTAGERMKLESRMIR